MMYQINETEMDSAYNKSMYNKWLFPVGFLFAGIVLSIIDKIIMLYYQYLQYSYIAIQNLIHEYTYYIYNDSLLKSLDQVTNINILSDLIYTYYMYPLILVALFLFFIVIICINLILKHSN
jgi:NADH:ubiquinone oxidoreductase subunit 6 (subunit J)